MIYWTLGNFLKPLTTIHLPKSRTVLGNFCEGVKIYHISSKIILGQLLLTFGYFFLVTLLPNLLPALPCKKSNYGFLAKEPQQLPERQLSIEIDGDTLTVLPR